jgi:DNA (cytosine-5)-methyltransferase 1
MKSGAYWERHEVRRPENLPSPVNNNFLPYPDEDRFPWLTVRDALSGLPESASSEDEAWQNHWAIPGARLYAGHAGSNLDWPAKAIKAGVHGVPGGENTLVEQNGTVRYFTLRETARIQTFPDEHFFVGARLHITRQIGNSAPNLLAETIARPLYLLLADQQTQRRSTQPMARGHAR